MTSFVLPHEVHGDGAHKVFAVHGWFADRSAYAAVLPDLDRAAFTYALVDLRGYGEARDAAGAYTTAEAAADLVELADRLGWERFSVLGHSMGGAVAQRLLALTPHRLRRIVGVSPVPASGLPLAGEQAALFTDAAHRPENRRAIIDVTTGGRRPTAWLDRMVARSLERSDAKAFRAWLDSWAGEDFHADVEGSGVPALAVAGALDPALSPEVVRQTWMSWYPRAELVTLPSAGHYAMDECPLELVRTVEDFLRADGAGPAGGANGEGHGVDEGHGVGEGHGGGEGRSVGEGHAVGQGRADGERRTDGEGDRTVEGRAVGNEDADGQGHRTRTGPSGAGDHRTGESHTLGEGRADGEARRTGKEPSGAGDHRTGVRRVGGAGAAGGERGAAGGRGAGAAVRGGVA